MEIAVAYIRVSSQRQVDEGGSLDVQKGQVDRRVLDGGYRLLRIFKEEGASAKTDQRPRLQEMLAFCKDRSNGVQVVIIPKIDRLARNVSDYTNLKLQLNRLGIRLESLGEKIEDTPVGRFTETILASVAQFDNEIRAERSKGGMVAAVSQGRWVWKPPVGYRSVRHQGKGTIEPDPVMGPAVREAFRMLAYGRQGAADVLEHLRRSGVERSPSTVHRMVENEAYIGRIRAFGNAFEASAPFVPLIDEVTFHKAREALRRPSPIRQYEYDSDDFPLRGAMLCGCGKRFTASWSRGKQGERYPYYRCVHCRGRSYRRDAVHTQFARELGAYKGRQYAWERLAEKLAAHAEEASIDERRDREKGTARIEELKELRGAVALKNASGVIPDDVAKAEIDRLGREIADVAAALPQERAETNVTELVEFGKRFFDDLQEAWQRMSLGTKKDLLGFMFPEGILFHPESGFRTPGLPLSERLKQEVSGVEFQLVGPAPEDSKELREWLEQMRTNFRDLADVNDSKTIPWK